jgi:hypothetical protein
MVPKRLLCYNIEKSACSTAAAKASTLLSVYSYDFHPSDER